MKNFSRFAVMLALIVAPMMACGTAKAEPCGIRCLTAGTSEPAPTTAPTK